MDTRSDGSAIMWGFDSTRRHTFSGVVDYRAVVADAGSWTSDSGTLQPGLAIEIDCERPITVSGFQAGREAVVFRRDSMKGGHGASASDGLTTRPAAGVTMGDRLATTFRTSASVQMRVTDRYSTGVINGTLGLTSPAGSRSWQLDGEDDIAVQGGPGAWTVTLDRQAAIVEGGDNLLGVLYGLTPAAGLEEAFRAG